MYQIDDLTAVTPVPAPPTDDIGTPGFFTGGDPATTVPATRVRFWWLNCVQQALIGLLVGAGVAQSKTDFTVVPQAVAIIGRRQAVYGTPGTYSLTVPAGVYRISIRIWGAGGSGNNCVNLNYPGGGGGAGGYSEGYFAVTPGQVLTIVIGQGTAAAAGGASSVSIVGGATLITANGGGLGQVGGTSSVGGGGMGGTATGGSFCRQGDGGSSGIAFGTSSSNVEGGRGAPGFGGSHSFASGSTSTGFNANQGSFPGGGSSGCTNSTAPGGAGLALLEY